MSNESEGSKPWTAIVVEKLLTSPYFSVLLQDVTVPDRTKRQYYTIDYPTAAVGIIARRGSDVLLLRQYRFIVDEYVWAIPSGGAHIGESLEAAAARELEEESGYRAGRLTPFLWCYASYGSSNQRYEIFLADDLVQTGRSGDANEVIEVRWFSMEELLALISENGIVDNLSLSPLLLLALQRS